MTDVKCSRYAFHFVISLYWVDVFYAHFAVYFHHMSSHRHRWFQFCNRTLLPHSIWGTYIRESFSPLALAFSSAVPMPSPFWFSCQASRWFKQEEIDRWILIAYVIISSDWCRWSHCSSLVVMTSHILNILNISRSRAHSDGINVHNIRSWNQNTSIRQPQV